MDKIQLLETINDSEEVLKIVKNILEKSEYEITLVPPNIAIGEYIVPITGKLRNLFIVSTDALGRGYKEFAQLKDEIGKRANDYSCKSIFLISNKNISLGFQDKLTKQLPTLTINFWGRDLLISKIDELYEDYWRHDDQDLLKYEKYFQNETNDGWGINKLRQFKEANKRLLDIFIEPRLLRRVSDKESSKKAVERININDLKEFKYLTTLTGDPGVGKTRLLKQLGCHFLKENIGSTSKYVLPIFIDNIDLIESKNETTGLVDIKKAIETKLKGKIPFSDLTHLSNKYRFVLLIDSVDDFDNQNQERFSNDLHAFFTTGAMVFLGTKYHDSSLIKGVSVFEKLEEVIIERFNDTQIKLFLETYFKANTNKASTLLESLKENNIIQRLPITPLTLSLISILYEENNYEVPATITDIFDNFSNLLLGRSLPDSKYDFFDVNIRERILSVYALELLNRGERNYMTVSEFTEYFMNFFKDVSGTIKLELLPEALNFLINNTGILVLQDDKYVRFHHESYLEYYASREIFYYKKEEYEPKLIDNFLQLDWQYAAIFYAGRTKSMSNFLSKVIEKTKNSRKVNDFYKSVSGLGYLIQALYMTEDDLRKDAILQSLNCSVEIYEWMKKLSSDETYFFRNLPLPLTAMIGSFVFFEYNNSIAVVRPLKLAFDKLATELEYTDEFKQKRLDYNVAYKLYMIALTLSSSRINDLSKMSYLIEQTALLKDGFFEKLLDLGLTIAGSKELYTLQESLKKTRIYATKSLVPGNKSVSEQILTLPAGRYRFSKNDKILPNRDILLLTEGKTDVEIIEHAYIMLTDQLPYWNIAPVDEFNGGANKLAKCLANGKPLLSDEKAVIGIFDNDSKGIQEFNGELKPNEFEFWQDSRRIKKHKQAEIFGLKLPVPPSRQHYIKETQQFNFFCIEHYFSDDLLEEYDMLEPTEIPDVFTINSKKKSSFSKAIRKLTDSKIFKDFYYLFSEIDRITNHEIEYKV